MTVDEAKADRVFLALLTQLCGSEGEIEKLSDAFIDALAVGFVAGRAYEHPELPWEGDRIHIDPLPLPTDITPPERYHVLLSEFFGVWHLYAGVTDQGDAVTIAINPETMASKTMGAQLDDERDDDEADAWKRSDGES
jgi:hypothetical protein